MSISSPASARNLLRAIAFISAVNLLSSILFIFLVRSPVYDDSFNMFDVVRYAAHGISINTIRGQKNVTGPTSFIWMSLAVHLVNGDALLDARLAVLLSWILSVLLLVLIARHSEWAELWYFGLLAALTFPHTLTASATALTEGPALLFAYAGTSAWIQGFWRRTDLGRTALAWVVPGGLCMGIAVTCRQYFLALLPSAGLLVILLIWRHRSNLKASAYGELMASLAFAALPSFLLVAIWRGITSPSMAAGKSYSNYQAGVGLALFRPVDVAFYVLVYLLPYCFPAMWLVPRNRRWASLFISMVGGFAAAHFRQQLVNPGPLSSFLDTTSRFSVGTFLPFWAIATLAIYNAIAVGQLLWVKRSELRKCFPVVFALSMVLFFVLEQFGVGGNVPFYDRYVLQLAPFLGIVGFWLSPVLTRLRIFVLGGLLVLSHAMLWRYAFVLK